MAVMGFYEGERVYWRGIPGAILGAESNGMYRVLLQTGIERSLCGECLVRDEIERPDPPAQKRKRGKDQ